MHLACINLGYVYQTMALVQGVEPCFVAWWTRRLELNQHLFAHYIMLLLESYCPTVRRHQHFLLLYPICPQRHLKEDVAVITIRLSRRKWEENQKTQADSYIVHLKVKCPHLATSNLTPTPPHYPEGIYQSINQLKKSKLNFDISKQTCCLSLSKGGDDPCCPGFSMLAKHVPNCSSHIPEIVYLKSLGCLNFLCRQESNL